MAPKVGRAVALYESQAYEENSQQDEEVDLVFEKPKRQKTKTTETGTVAVATPSALVPAEHQEDLTQMVSTRQDLQKRSSDCMEQFYQSQAEASDVQ